MQLKHTFLFLITTAVVICSPLLQQHASADIVVNSRFSRTYFDVFAGVGPVSDRRRETPTPNELLTGTYQENFDYIASAIFDNGVITGSSNSHGDLFHRSSLNWNSSGLVASYSDLLSGSTINVEDGAGFVDIRSEFQLVFTLDTAMSFEFDGVIGPISGDTSPQFQLRHTNTATNLYNFTSSGAYSESGVLVAGDYRLRVVNSGSDFNDPPFDSNMGWTFQVGSSVPEPGHGLLLLIGGLGLVHRRRREA